MVGLNFSVISFFFCLTEERRSGDIFAQKWDSDRLTFSKLVHFMVLHGTYTL